MIHKISKEKQTKIQTSKIKTKMKEILKSQLIPMKNQVDVTKRKFKNTSTKITLSLAWLKQHFKCKINLNLKVK